MAIQNQSSLASQFTLPDETIQEVTNQSNILITTNLTAEFTKVKISQKTFAQPLEELTQEIQLNNNSEFEISNISFTDILSDGATFKAGSVDINGVVYEEYDPTVGFILPNNIVAGGFVTMTYTIVIDAEPEVETVTNKGTLIYTADGNQFTEDTNTVSIAVINNKISIVKSANANTVISGSTLVYTSVITNDGTFTNTQLVFTDAIPEGTTFVVGSVKIDGVDHSEYNPAVGFSLNDLSAGQSTTVEFSVTVI